jgi:hypothetical protein
LGLVLVAAGCGPSTGTVSGVVRYKGEPLAGYVVTMIAPDDRLVTAITDDQGAYTIPNAPVGTLKVMVSPPHRPPPVSEEIRKIREKSHQKVRPPDTQPASKIVNIPDRYKNKDQTPLTFTVEGGQQTYDPEVTD